MREKAISPLRQRMIEDMRSVRKSDDQSGSSARSRHHPRSGEFCNIPPLFGAVLSRRECTMATKTPPIPPLFKADAATLSFYGSNTGAVSVSYQGWDASKVVLEGGRCCGGFRIEAVDPH